MKNIKKLLVVLLLFFSLILVVGCASKTTESPTKEQSTTLNSVTTEDGSTTTEDKSNTSDDSSTTSEEPVVYTLDDVIFEDATFEYDGEMHSIYVDHVPEGAKVTYQGNEKSLPSTYTVTATVKLDGQKVKLTATMTISKADGTLTADTEQEAYLTSGPASVTYTLDHPEQEVKTKKYYKPGVYEETIFAASTPYVNRTNSVTITLTVKESKLGCEFLSATYPADGNEHSVTLSNLPAGYTVEYENNSASKAGTYGAIAKVYNAEHEKEEEYHAILKIENPDNEAFNTFLDEIFVYLFEGDQLSSNIFIDDLANFPGLEHYDAKWYTYSGQDEESEIAEFKTELNEKLAALHAFDVETLSAHQYDSYRIVESNLNNYLNLVSVDYDQDLMTMGYLDQYGGYTADFAQDMEAYTIRNEQDVIDIISYVNSLPEAFASYLTFAHDKAEAGYPYSDFTIDECRGYLKDVIDDGADYYLFPILRNKITRAQLDNIITSEKATQYLDELNAAFTNSFTPAFQALYDGLEQYKGLCEEEGYLTIYEHGKDVYKSIVERKIGYSDLDMDEFLADLTSKISEYNQGINDAVSVYQKASATDQARFMDYIQGKRNITGLTDPNEMITFLKEFAKTIVPDLKATPSIVVSEMDESVAKRTTTVAYYMKSAVDKTDVEYIHLNPLSLGDDYNDTLSTMAHEGYPGHLYAYVYTKELGLHPIEVIFTNTGHGEGWATYVQLELYKYLGEQSGDPIVQAALDYLYYNQLLSYNIYTRIDFGVNYQDWKQAEILSFMKKAGFTVDEDGALNLFRMFIEVPSQYYAYGYGQTVIYQAHKFAQEALGDWYDVIEFNKEVLAHGWAELEYFNENIYKYIDEQMFIHGMLDTLE